MNNFIFVACIVAVAGAAGGLANYLLLPPPKSVRGYLWSAVRFMVVGAIVAFAVPLFLSLAQSELVRKITEPSADLYPYGNLLVLIGFCVVAGFASRTFMHSLAAKVMQLEHQVQNLGEKTEEAVEAAELNEESTDRALEAIRGAATTKELESGQLPGEPETSQSREAITEVVPELTPIEHTVVQATSRHNRRTLSGVAKDAQISRPQAEEIVDELVRKGLIQHTTSPNSGGPRIQVTRLGTIALNKLALRMQSEPISNPQD
jgi:DNA-binding MarR family transcriptional regulator/outer membrane murein-binding lipoprotein Lpp